MRKGIFSAFSLDLVSGVIGFVAEVYLNIPISESERYKEYLESIMKGPVFITLRHRLRCRIMRSKDNCEDGCAENGEDYLVLNEVSIDRGMSAYLTNLECYCDNLFVTVVQGDGLILSTPSGSTAYSLAAGGSMVHPQVCTCLKIPILGRIRNCCLITVQITSLVAIYSCMSQDSYQGKIAVF